MKSTWSRLSRAEVDRNPTASNSRVASAVTTMASGKPAVRAITPRRTRSPRRSTRPTATAASGPNSGPSTIAPTTVTDESVIAPIAASRHAIVRNAW